ncbi:hypothetical protein C0J52_13272 [Blattella germanica]|nr:hypothetical protein C0J52_13272 [Blattella germanica]
MVDGGVSLGRGRRCLSWSHRLQGEDDQEVCTIKLAEDQLEEDITTWIRQTSGAVEVEVGYFQIAKCSKPESQSGRPAPLLQEPRFGAGPQPYRGDGIVRGGVVPSYVGGPDRYEDGYQNGPPGSYSDQYGDRYQPDR